MNRCIIFAHFDKDNIIDDYVINYLTELKKISSDIIFVSDCNLPENEVMKLYEITNHIIAKRHSEYDWGSYKYGFKYLEENLSLNDTDELILCNDSVYGPLYPLEPYIKKLSEDISDFGGMYKNNYGFKQNTINPHIQSWFLLLKKQVFCSDIFKNFIYGINKETTKENIIEKYEIDFTKTMEQRFSYSYLFSATQCDAVFCLPFKLIKNGFPFCKVKAATIYNIVNLIQARNKKIGQLIKKHQERCFKKNYFINFMRHIKRFFTCHNVVIETNIDIPD